MNDRGRRIVFICIAAIFAVFMTVMNRLTPLYMDDYCYAFMFDKVDKHHVIYGFSPQKQKKILKQSLKLYRILHEK